METSTRRLPGDGRWLMVEWRADPTPEATARLCDWLAARSDRIALSPDAVDEIACHVAVHQADDVTALLAVGRLVLSQGDRFRALRFMVRAAQIARDEGTLLDDPETWDPESSVEELSS